MMNNSRRWGVWLSREKYDADTELLEQLPDNKALKDHVIICGFGRVGQTVSRFLKQEFIEFVAIDIDPLRTSKAREAGENLLFGSSRKAELLNAAHISTAKLVVISFGEDKQSIEVIQKVRALSPHVPILVRTRNDDHLELIKDAGANEVVPESLEGSLMLVSQVLSLYGVPLSRVSARLTKERENHYTHLHGFFQGAQTDMSPEALDRIEFAQATLLTEDAYAVSHTIGSLNLEKMEVSIISLKRQNKEIENPDDDIELKEQDTLILRGKPHHVEMAVRYCQKGKK
jgi:CPA2 family monovalent cation:H+ antiporter-2